MAEDKLEEAVKVEHDPTEGSETAKREESAWKAYVSTCHTGGTDNQRRWAFGQWLKALDKRMQLRKALAVKREEIPRDITTDA
jgi:hypothetical protein